MSVWRSACPHVAARLPLNGFPWNLVLGAFMPIRLEALNLVEIGQKRWAAYIKTWIPWCEFDRASSLIRGNEGPARCNTLVFYCKTYCLLNMFRAPLYPSSGALELYRWLLPAVEQYPANRTHNPQLHTRPTTCKPKSQIPHLYNSRAPDDGHDGARNMLSKQ